MITGIGLDITKFIGIQSIKSKTRNLKNEY